MLLLPEDLAERNTFLCSSFTKGTVAFIERWRCLTCSLGNERLCMQMGNSRPCGSQKLNLWVKYLRMVPTEKSHSREQVKLWRHCNKWSSHKLLLVEDLEKFGFGLRDLWGWVQSAACRPPVWQVKLFPGNSVIQEISTNIARSRWGKTWEKGVTQEGGGFAQDEVSKVWVKLLLVRCCCVICRWYADS